MAGFIPRWPPLLQIIPKKVQIRPSHSQCHPLVPWSQKSHQLNIVNTLSYLNLQLSPCSVTVLQYYRKVTKTDRSSHPCWSPISSPVTLKSRQRWRPRGGVGLWAERAVRECWDADRGQVLYTNPDRTADRGRRTDDELNRKPEDSDTHHQESVSEPHTCPLTTIARIHSKCQEANISSRIWFLSRLSSQGLALGSLWIDYSEIFSLQPREIKVKGLKKTCGCFTTGVLHLANMSRL